MEEDSFEHPPATYSFGEDMMNLLTEIVIFNVLGVCLCKIKKNLIYINMLMLFKTTRVSTDHVNKGRSIFSDLIRSMGGGTVFTVVCH